MGRVWVRKKGQCTALVSPHHARCVVCPLLDVLKLLVTELVITLTTTMSTPWWFFLIAAGLIVMSGFFSGLNLGLMSLAPDELKVVMEGSADEQAKRDAAKIYPLRKRGNLLL